MARKVAGKSSRSKSKGTASRSKSTTKRTARRATARPKVPKRAPASKRAAVRAKGDFGIPARKRDVALAASEETKNRPGGKRRQDPRQPRTGVDSRQSGVGKRDAGPGSDSGGDLDADVVGITGAALAQSGPDEEANIGAAETSGGSEEFASGPPARGQNQPRGRQIVRGDVVDREGDATSGDPDAGGIVGRTQATDAGAGFGSIDQRRD
jgi:hypothetical protein